MNELKKYIFLFLLTAFSYDYTLGVQTKISISAHGSHGADIPIHTERELNRVGHFHHGQPERVENLRDLKLSPELNFHTPEAFSSSHPKERQDFSSYNKNDKPDIHSEAEFGGQSEISSIIDDLIDTGYISLYPKEESKPERWSVLRSMLRPTPYPVRRTLTERHEFLLDLPNDPTPKRDTNLMIELTSGSGVMINQLRLKNIVEKYRYHPRQLIRELLKEYITDEDLAIMTPSNRKGFKPFPDHIMKAVQDFVIKTNNFSINPWEFQRYLYDHLRYLRTLKKIEKQNVGLHEG